MRTEIRPINTAERMRNPPISIVIGQIGDIAMQRAINSNQNRWNLNRKIDLCNFIEGYIFCT